MPGFGSAGRREGPAYTDAARKFTAAVDELRRQLQEDSESATKAVADIATQFARLGVSLEREGVAVGVDDDGEPYYVDLLGHEDPFSRLETTHAGLGLPEGTLKTVGDAVELIESGRRMVYLIHPDTLPAYRELAKELEAHYLLD